MQNIKELSTKEMKQIIDGENEYRMPDELNRSKNLSNGGAKLRITNKTLNWLI